uniref:ATPase subunit 8 n=1 Tax=Cavenderia fasciculata TaxID=261658 RepID=B2XX82_CACFS|nr:ATPase subunit 8 [Cavenderia fasciculata]ABX45204.1 ATPase subunit 8 [Cavenderia fasciculata]
MPQLDSLIFFNEMIHLIVGFGVFYVLFVRIIIVKLAYILKGREKLLSRNVFQKLDISVFNNSVYNLKKVYNNLNYINSAIGAVKSKVVTEIIEFVKTSNHITRK